MIRDTDDPRTIVTAARVKEFRKKNLLTRRDLSYALGKSQGYIRAVECGALPITKPFATTFLRVEQDSYGARHIQSKHVLPRDVLILAKPRKCRGCKRMVVFGNAMQKYCDARCKRAASERKRGK